MSDQKKTPDPVVVVPDLGEAVTEATVSGWLVLPGDHVAADQVIVTIETDKVTVELAAPIAGVLEPVSAVADTLKIGEPIARIVPPPPRDAAREQTHAELLAAVTAAPDDAGVRQVYADFLLQAGGPIYPWGAGTTALRGEYLTIAARLAQPRPGDDIEAMTARRAALESCARSTALSLLPVGGDPIIVDGFVRGWTSTIAMLEASHAAIFARAPLRALAVKLYEDDAADRLLAIPRLEQLHELALIGANSDVELPDDAVARIVGSPRLSNLRVLELHRQTLGPAAGAALATAPRELELGTCKARAGMAAAVGARAFDRLEISHTDGWDRDELERLISRPIGELVLSGNGAPTDLSGVTALRVLRLVHYRLDGWVGLDLPLERLVLRCEFRGERDLFSVLARIPAVGVLDVARSQVDGKPIATYADAIRAAVPDATVLA